MQTTTIIISTQYAHTLHWTLPMAIKTQDGLPVLQIHLYTQHQLCR